MFGHGVARVGLMSVGFGLALPVKAVYRHKHQGGKRTAAVFSAVLAVTVGLK